MANRQPQLRLRLAKPKRARRGKRPGRKPTHSGRPRVRHVVRAKTHERFPVHVTKRVRREVARLRGWDIAKVLRRAFVHGCRLRSVVDGDRMIEFRICQFSIQGNHLHMICEATDNQALARGIQGWSVRVARGLNGCLGRAGTVFDDRYHLEVLTSPTQTRNALCYVLHNARRHGESLPTRYNGIDPFSSAWWFDGWDDDSWRIGIPPPEDRSVAEAQTWLLREGWKRAKRGLITLTEVPAGRK
jgi:REP-associated tyrosine transposase